MKKYNSIDGLRTIACLGIILMHILANLNYKLDNEKINVIINSFTQFVYLFFIISSFSMCCGYYEKIKNNDITVNDFYKKRFLRILPFFSIIIVLDIALERSITTIYEGFLEVTLLFGFLPLNKLSVIGVAWFIGVVCVFYIIFPFFVFLFDNKKRGWIVFAITFIINILCQKYFFSETFLGIDYPNRHNFLYDMVYFSIGGLIYLYREEIEKYLIKEFVLFFAIIVTLLYFILPYRDVLFTVEMLTIFASWLIFAIIDSNNIFLDNRITKFISYLSLEMYLSHMIIFRIVEKIGLTRVFNNSYLSYAFCSFLVITGVILFSFLAKKLLIIVKNKIVNLKCNNLNEL